MTITRSSYTFPNPYEQINRMYLSNVRRLIVALVCGTTGQSADTWIVKLGSMRPTRILR